MAQTARNQGASNNSDVLIIGGGIIGLSLAWELAQHGTTVCVVDRGPIGQEASWAGAGMIPPGPERSRWQAATPLEQLAGLSQNLHRVWHEQLLELTGTDNEYRRCGAIQLATTDDEAQTLKEKQQRWQSLGIACSNLDAQDLAAVEPALAERLGAAYQATYLPSEAQIRNPRHLRALIAACQIAGVDLRAGVAVREFQVRGDRLIGAITSEGVMSADSFCLTAGCWTGQLANRLGLELPVRPIRGQIVLLHGRATLITHNVNVGTRYLVPRADGRLLIGSTQEDVGFVKQNTPEAAEGLKQFAASMIPDTARLPIEACWSGLRPATADDLPYLGPLPRLENGWLATGHFRAGLQLSPATAVVMRALLLRQTSPIDISSLGMQR